ncbi:cadherin-like domain-containing protein, partial [Roseiconus lacunae]
WDQTTGSAGAKVDASTNGGTTAFSTATEAVSITVTDINDEQVIATNTGATVVEGSSGNVISNTQLRTTDADHS